MSAHRRPSSPKLRIALAASAGLLVAGAFAGLMIAASQLGSANERAFKAPATEKDLEVRTARAAEKDRLEQLAKDRERAETDKEALESSIRAEKIRVANDAKKKADKALDERVEALWPQFRRSYVCIDKAFIRLPEAFPDAEPSSPSVGTTCAPELGYEVLHVKGPNDVILAPKYIKTSIYPVGLQLKQRFSNATGPAIRLSGYSTQGVVDGATLDSMPIAVIGTCKVSVTAGSRTIFLAVPTGSLSEGLSKEEFRQMLKEGINPEK